MRKDGCVFLLPLLLALLMLACSQTGNAPIQNEMVFAKDNLIAWCIIPFDAARRTPAQRAQMLTDLGIKKLAWDWRMEHVPQLGEEIDALDKNDIELSAVWLWIDKDLEKGFPTHFQQIFDTLQARKVNTTFWVSFSDNYFDNYDDNGKLNAAVRNISILNKKAVEMGCKVALYNHTGWFGEPQNQVDIIEAIGSGNVGIVYNFHHGHEHINDFPRLLRVMQPYLLTINLNGMVPGGPKILDLGAGEHEAKMMKAIKESGFTGTIGIIGHTEGEDIEDVLVRNLEGMQKILSQNGDINTLKTYLD